MAVDQMEEYNFADKEGKVLTFTGDNLAASLDPPEIYGNIDIQGGGRVTMNIADINIDDMKIGLPVIFTFRVSNYDERRNITRYFWKAIPK